MGGSALQIGPAPTYGDAQTCIHCRHCQRHERPVPHPHGGAPSRELLNMDCTLNDRCFVSMGNAYCVDGRRIRYPHFDRLVSAL